MWQIDLEGEAVDISELQKLAPHCGCSIHEGPDGRPCLSGTLFANLSSPQEVKTEADKILALLNGLSRMKYSNHRPVQSGSAVSFMKPEGGRSIALLVPTAYIRMRMGEPAMTVIRADGTIETPLSANRMVERVKCIIADPTLSEIATAVSGELSWQKLRVAFEKLNALIGKGDNALVKNRYATQGELDEFKANVQDPRHSGLEAVHGVASGPLRGSKMSIDKGLKFLVRLLNEYIDRKIQQDPIRE
jgi:hypothetical protein